jgi:hypothetical protein
MQEFPNFEDLQFFKNKTFSKFSENLSFYFRDLRSRKKLLECTVHKESPKKKLAGIGEPIVPTFGELANIDPSVKMATSRNESQLG